MLLARYTVPYHKRNMQLTRSLENYHPARPLALAIGNFDGLHRGHQAVVGRMLALAKAQQLCPAILTFEPHPRRFFAPSTPSFRLQTLHDKLAQLRGMGVEQVFALRFDARMAALKAEDFLQEMLYRQMQVRAVVTGENFVFGQGRSGDMAMLQRWGAAQGVHAEPVAPVMVEGQVCSSTAVRETLAGGDMARARALLARPYSMSGPVRHGDKRGRTLGFATANIVPSASMKLPRFGVYAVTVQHGGQRLRGVANLGVRPSVVHAGRAQLEVHLFDFTGDVYGQKLRVELHAHLRDEKRFDSLPALTHQIAQDAQQARAVLEEIA